LSSWPNKGRCQADKSRGGKGGGANDQRPQVASNAYQAARNNQDPAAIKAAEDVLKVAIDLQLTNLCAFKELDLSSYICWNTAKYYGRWECSKVLHV
jgi:hypothetical protein